MPQKRLGESKATITRKQPLPKTTITPLRESKATPENDKKSNVPNKDLLLKNRAVVVKRTVVRNI